MKIDESCVRLESSHEYERHQQTVRDSNFSFSQAMQDAAAALPADQIAPPSLVAARRQDEQQRLSTLLLQLLNEIIERITGEKCRAAPANFAALPGQDSSLSRLSQLSAPTDRPVRVIEWQSRTVEQIDEHEKTAVTASGTVHTADGRSISFDLGLRMCRDFSCRRESEESGRIELKDPLVINFTGQAAALSDRRFSFDLDADGAVESLPELATGSGYLAFDADHDGKIGDGRELFGATGKNAGDGFADLARLDADKNGWIDEADPAFAALAVWFPDGQLQTLQETGVGALNLDSAYSPFALTDEQNNPRGQIWRTGVFLKENGEAGTLQQVDLAVEKPGLG